MMAHESGGSDSPRWNGSVATVRINGRWPWLAFAALSLALCALWLFVWPQGKAAGRNPFEYLVLRWGHAATWAFLFLGASMRLLGKKGSRASERLLSLGGAAYLAFILVAYVL